MSRWPVLAVYTATAVIVLLFPSVAAPVGATPAASFHYDATTIRTLRKSGIRVMLPTALPGALRTATSVAVIDADRAGYYVGFSPIRHCSGALSCAFLHVAGYAVESPAGRAYGMERTVVFADGLRGSYTPRTCSGASCTESSLTFARAGVVYEIDARLGRDALPVLLAVAREMRYLQPEPARNHGR